MASTADRCAVITNAASGIGHATTALLAPKVRILVVDRPGIAASFWPGAINLVATDIGADDAPVRIADSAGERFGRLDILSKTPRPTAARRCPT